MQSNELMIGDYVIRKNVPKEILIVVAIDSIRNIVYLDLDGLGITEKIENLEPISITPENLEKNFEPLDIEGEYFGFYDEYFEVEVSEYTDGMWEVKIYEIEMGNLPTWRMYVSNVHEIQHALRLCGVDKEIKI